MMSSYRCFVCCLSKRILSCNVEFNIQASCGRGHKCPHTARSRVVKIISLNLWILEQNEVSYLRLVGEFMLSFQVKFPLFIFIAESPEKHQI